MRSSSEWKGKSAVTTGRLAMTISATISITMPLIVVSSEMVLSFRKLRFSVSR
ncbi:hypothetical protein D3C72_2326950 [compost metagenome]